MTRSPATARVHPPGVRNRAAHIRRLRMPAAMLAIAIVPTAFFATPTRFEAEDTGLTGPTVTSEASTHSERGGVDCPAQNGGSLNRDEMDRADLSLAPLLPVPAVPCDPQATPQARALLSRLAADYGKRTWSGQQSADEIHNVARLSGRKPLILLWVLTSEDPAWYPGDDVVDIVGVDAYPADKSDVLLSRWEPLKARFDGRKIMALTEFGGVPDIEKMHRLGVWFAYFASWTGSYGPAAMPESVVRRVYQSPWVVTLEAAP